MDPNRQIQQRFAQIFERMAVPVLWQERRDTPEEKALQGYLTRGAGPEAPWEFRFQQVVPGLRQGAVLRTHGSQERWAVDTVLEEHLEAELLYVVARVEPLQGGGGAPLEQGLDVLLQSLAQLLEVSTLSPLRRDDAAEALHRLARLSARPGDPEHALRLKERLKLLDQLFKACPQTGKDAKRLLLKLEAQLKRRGYP